MCVFSFVRFYAFVFLAKVCNLKLFFSRKHREYALVFFSHLEIMGESCMVDEEMKEERFALFKTQSFS